MLDVIPAAVIMMSASCPSHFEELWGVEECRLPGLPASEYPSMIKYATHTSAENFGAAVQAAVAGLSADIAPNHEDSLQQTVRY